MKRIHIIAACSAFVALAGAAVGCAVAVTPAGGACGNQPNMANALAELRAARAELDLAEHDKGGWRAGARQQTEDAIRETVRGCQFANGN